MPDSRYILSSNTPSTVGLSGTYDFRNSVLALPTGSNPPTPIGSNISFIKTSGVIALWDGSAWKTLSVGGGGGIPSPFDTSDIWIDLNAGTVETNSPQSLVTNPSGATTGSSDGTLTFSTESGIRCWTFADNGGIEIYNLDSFNYADNNPWVKTYFIIWKSLDAGTSTRSIMGIQPALNANGTFTLVRLSSALGYKLRLTGNFTFDTTTVVNASGLCHASFIVMSGSKSGANLVASGTYYDGKGAGENYGPVTVSPAPGVAWLVIGDIGGTNSRAMAVWGAGLWSSALSQSQRNAIVDYYAGVGINVL